MLYVTFYGTCLSCTVLPLLQWTLLPVILRCPSPSIRQLKLHDKCDFRFMYKHVQPIRATFPRWESKRFQTAKVTQICRYSACHWCHIIIIWIPLSLICNHRGQSASQIWIVYIHTFQRYDRGPKIRNWLRDLDYAHLGQFVISRRTLDVEYMHRCKIHRFEQGACIA